MRLPCDGCGEPVVNIVSPTATELENQLDDASILCFACKKQPRTRGKEKLRKMRAYDD